MTDDNCPLQRSLFADPTSNYYYVTLSLTVLCDLCIAVCVVCVTLALLSDICIGVAM